MGKKSFLDAFGGVAPPIKKQIQNQIVEKTTNILFYRNYINEWFIISLANFLNIQPHIAVFSIFTASLINLLITILKTRKYYRNKLNVKIKYDRKRNKIIIVMDFVSNIINIISLI
jgi:hypothetical protein